MRDYHPQISQITQTRNKNLQAPGPPNLIIKWKIAICGIREICGFPILSPLDFFHESQT